MEMLTPVTVRALLAENGIRPKKSLGQHFLADPNTARRVATLADVQPGDQVLEIGPGLGSLTLALRSSAARTCARSSSTPRSRGVGAGTRCGGGAGVGEV